MESTGREMEMEQSLTRGDIRKLRGAGRARAGNIKPLLAITMGDPAGVGPELCLRLLCHGPTLRIATPLVFGDSDVLCRVARECGLEAPTRIVTLREFQRGEVAVSGPAVIHCGAIEASTVRPGEILAEHGRAAFVYIRNAVKSAMRGLVQAIVTCPIHKAALRLAGVPYPGHTEMLAHMTGTKSYCMMMASEELRVSLVTAHVPLRKVPRILHAARILEVIRLTHDVLRRLGIKKPRIAVCGLNPHAGDWGVIGPEEARLIFPAVEQARKQGMVVNGPLCPDTAFLASQRRAVDAYVVMYHDQGLIPFKLLAFDVGVNITLGLPLVRTSVDHGTAFDIAWTGRASPTSLISAVSWAVRLI
ncbi:MAG: 4-hydroxythreonine-4-phosphate dehydrogenase PdxA [Kiritimatiellae bacterium]|nr:4-hydroxythreonine-4-phosphate dehydrogenase PdxA [Kiritimatiellia bacterium]